MTTVTVGMNRKTEEHEERQQREGRADGDRRPVPPARGGRAQLMTFDQFSARYSPAVSGLLVGRDHRLPPTSGSASQSAPSMVPASAIASPRTGRAPPLSQRFWPSSL